MVWWKTSNLIQLPNYSVPFQLLHQLPMLKRYGIIEVNISTDWRLRKITSLSTHRGRQQAKKFIQSRQTISSFINQSLYFKCPQKMMLELLISYSSSTSSLLTNHSHTECLKIRDPDTSYNGHFLTQYLPIPLFEVSGQIAQTEKMKQPLMITEQHWDRKSVV